MFILVVGAGGDRKDLKYTECPTLVSLRLRFPDLANKNHRYPVKFVIQITSANYFSRSTHTSTKKAFVFYVKFEYNWAPCILSGTHFWNRS